MDDVCQKVVVNRADTAEARERSKHGLGNRFRPTATLRHTSHTFTFPRRRQRTSGHDMDSNSRRAPCARKHFSPPQNSSRHRLYVRLDFVHSSLQSQISRLLTLAENPRYRNQDDSAISRVARWNCATRFMRVDSHPSSVEQV